MGRRLLGLMLALGLTGPFAAVSHGREPEDSSRQHATFRFVSDSSGFGMRVAEDSASATRRDPLTMPVPARAAPLSTPQSWPVTLDEVRARAKKQEKPEPTWSEAEVKAARARCHAILKKINAVALEEAPIRQGECGTPAPIRLVSFGRKPEVVISPPALINCEMAEALHAWVTRDLQPLARRHLGGPIIKIEKMSDYSCRNAYGRARGRLSEHGRVNAIDIAGFVTSRGESTMLLADWGMTARDIRRQVAAAKARAVADDQRRLDAEREGQRRAVASHGETSRTSAATALPPAAVGTHAGAPAGGIARASIIEGAPRVTFSIAGGEERSGPPPATLGGFVSKLGGPVPRADTWGETPTMVVLAADAAGVAPAGRGASEAGKNRFLRAAHEAACRIFGTVLGPEANNAHRNHFHLDLAERKSGAFCQ
ncbi:MAG: extensin family protein [Hyphomicrobiaceae bacterium]